MTTPDEITLDAIDRRIVRLLQEDAGLSNNALADRVGLSPARSRAGCSVSMTAA